MIQCFKEKKEACIVRQIEKISLIGLGAMGSFFAPRLYAEFGTNFHVIAGGDRKERLEKEGVRINGETYHFPVLTPETKGNIADLIIIATKGYSLDQAMKDIQNQVGEHTQIMAVMNGVEAEDKLIAAFGQKHVLHSFMRVSIVMKDGIANFDPTLGAVHFGEVHNKEGEYSDRVQSVKEVMDQCGIPYKIDSDMLFGIWYKFSCNVAENLTCALLGIPFGMFVINESANMLRNRAMHEVQNLAAAIGIEITEQDIEKQGEAIKRIPPENKPSTLQDLEAGKHTEIEMFAGTVIRLGKEYHVPTPICEVYYLAIKVLEAKNDLREKKEA